MSSVCVRVINCIWFWTWTSQSECSFVMIVHQWGRRGEWEWGIWVSTLEKMFLMYCICSWLNRELPWWSVQIQIWSLWPWEPRPLLHLGRSSRQLLLNHSPLCDDTSYIYITVSKTTDWNVPVLNKSVELLLNSQPATANMFVVSCLLSNIQNHIWRCAVFTGQEGYEKNCNLLKRS